MTQFYHSRVRFAPNLIALLVCATLGLSSELFAQTDNASEIQADKVEASEKEVDSSSNAAEIKNRELQQRLFWVFLSSGKSLEGVDTEKVEEMQSGHLANFKRLAVEGKLLSAGSITDPVESLQGVAIVAVDADQRLDQMFQDDELVKSGFRKIQATKMRLEHGVINAGNNQRNGMQEYRMVMIENCESKNGSDLKNQSLLEASRKFVSTMYEDKDVRLAVRLEKCESGRELILVFDKPEEEAGLMARLQKIPAVKSGHWKAKIVPVFFGKGTLNPS